MKRLIITCLVISAFISISKSQAETTENRKVTVRIIWLESTADMQDISGKPIDSLAKILDKTADINIKDCLEVTIENQKTWKYENYEDVWCIKTMGDRYSFEKAGKSGRTFIVTPIIQDENMIAVSFEINTIQITDRSNLEALVAGDIARVYGYPRLSTRKTKNTLLIKSGQPYVIGGLGFAEKEDGEGTTQKVFAILAAEIAK